jgi:hypothetical protein
MWSPKPGRSRRCRPATGWTGYAGGNGDGATVPRLEPKRSRSREVGRRHEDLTARDYITALRSSGPACFPSRGPWVRIPSPAPHPPPQSPKCPVSKAKSAFRLASIPRRDAYYRGCRDPLLPPAHMARPSASVSWQFTQRSRRSHGEFTRGSRGPLTSRQWSVTDGGANSVEARSLGGCSIASRRPSRRAARAPGSQRDVAMGRASSAALLRFPGNPEAGQGRLPRPSAYLRGRRCGIPGASPPTVRVS